MNLWALITSMILSLGLTATPVYRLPVVEIVTEGDQTKAILGQQVQTEKNTLLPHKIDNQSLGVKISAPSAAIMDRNTGTILWQKNANQVRSLASITKLMTALVFLDHNPGWEESVTMIQEDETNGNSANVLRGEVVKVRDLFYLSLVASDNNATNALVRSTGVARDEFIDLMNQKAKELGLVNTSFRDATGLSDANQSTALEILSLAKTAFAYGDIREVTSRQTYSFRTVGGRLDKVYSTNKLLYSYLDVAAGKTGHITAAGYCLVSEIIGDQNQAIIGVVLGSATNADRFYDLKILSAWTLNNFVWS